MIRVMGICLTAVIATGCTLVELDADIRSSCSTRHDLAVEPLPAGVLAPPTVDLEIELELDDLDVLGELEAELHFTHVRFRPISGIDDLVFIEAARVTVASADPDATLPTLTVVDCAGDCPREGADLLLPSDLDVDALDYAAAGTLIVGATIRGDLPAVAWTLDVEICAQGTASASAGL